MNTDIIEAIVRSGDQNALYVHFNEIYQASLTKQGGFNVHDAEESTFYTWCGNQKRDNKVRVTEAFQCGAIPACAWQSHATLEVGDFFRKHTPEGILVLHLVIAAGSPVQSSEHTQSGYSVPRSADAVPGYLGGVGLNGTLPPAGPGISFRV